MTLSPLNTVPLRENGYVCLADAQLRRYLRLRVTRRSLADNRNSIGRNRLAIRIPFPPDTGLGRSILHVGIMVAEKQMIWTDACRVVTGVAYLKSVRNRPIKYGEREAVGEDGFVVQPERPIAITGNACGPLPARVAVTFVYFGPETLLSRPDFAASTRTEARQLSASSPRNKFDLACLTHHGKRINTGHEALSLCGFYPVTLYVDATVKKRE